MGSPLLPGPPLPNALLSALSLVSALRTRQVNGAAAAGFALQSLCAACDAVAPLLAPPAAPPDPLPGCWVSALVAQPLVAFGFLWHAGDPGTATLLLAAAVALAPAAAGLPAEGRALAARGAVAAAAGCVLALAALVADGLGALGALLMGAGGLWPELRPWVLPPACLALQGALRGRRDGG
ncbi:putative protein LOC106896268, protein [Aix galericulata]|nr:putative protein LOC106896268, protein [Aix galericulata]